MSFLSVKQKLNFFFWISVFLIVISFLVKPFYYAEADIRFLRNYQPPLVSVFYSADGEKIAEFYKEARELTSLSEVPLDLINAYISAEDSRFFSHKGYDLISILRALISDVSAGRIVEGGSTIDQQLVRSAMLSSEKNFDRKLREVILAYRINREFSKNEILERSLNQVYFGRGAYGIKVAARRYFAKDLKDLNFGECAFLAGLPQMPSVFSYNQKKAKKRQIYVLNQMAANRYISAEKAREEAKREIKVVAYKPFFQRGYYIDHVRQYIEKKYGAQSLYEKGLKVYTALDAKMHRVALDSLNKGITRVEEVSEAKKIQAALLCVEFESGHVKAMLGGKDFIESPWNRAIYAKRPMGSVFKPVIYAAALESGKYGPDSVVGDFERNYWGYQPHNYDDKYHGWVTLSEALAQSYNAAAVKLLSKIGTKQVIDYAAKFRINSELKKNDLSIALGTTSASLHEIVRTYTSFANKGLLADFIFVTRVEDCEGNILETNKPKHTSPINSKTADCIKSFLRKAVESGTGQTAYIPGKIASAKTGTSSNYRDAWFVGFDKRFVTGVWVGSDKYQSLGYKMSGSRVAAPIWRNFMLKACAN